MIKVKIRITELLIYKAKKQVLGKGGTYKTKPCRFYNLSTCTAINCTFNHICGICGRPHRSDDFHNGSITMKNVICVDYNSARCRHGRAVCEYLHVCTKCKGPHPALQCPYTSIVCHVCDTVMGTVDDAILHQVSIDHIKRIISLRTRIYGPPGFDYELITGDS